MQDVPVRVRGDVADALARGEPVVALESTLIAHGLPRPDNLQVAVEVEQLVREAGAVPATVGVLRGQAVIGLDAAELGRIASRPEVAKLSTRDLAPAIAAGCDGATTVASTAALAARAGIAVFATGGIGGVHREAATTRDESADLATLASTPIVVVCAGVKSILDVGATLERLESLGVTVVGYGTRAFPGFYRSDSGETVDWTVEDPAGVAAIAAAQRGLSIGSGAVVVANPLSPDEQVEPMLHDRVLTEGLNAAREQRISGKAVTPFLLEHFHRATGGASLTANVAIIRRNARLAAEIAVAIAR
ncbi:MAG: pseudouridine-5'-phosphate glycosidase [Actinomycetota bacterium]|nr:pseudouridine-5'-phosphate glycosidase [Actinomycetota bacterium]